MRKKIFSIIFVTLFIFANIDFSNCTYQAQDGNIFHYEMLKADVSVKVGNTEYSGSKFYIAGYPLDVPYVCTLIVNTGTLTSVSSTLSGGGHSQSIFNSWVGNDKSYFTLNIIYPMLYSIGYLMNPSTASNGFGVMFIPFVDRALIGDFFEEFVTQTNSQLVGYMAFLIEPSFEAISTIEENVRYFESYFTGTAEFTGTPEYLIDFKLQFRCTYEYHTGFLLGMHYKSQGKGVLDGEKVRFTCESLVEKQGYDLPKAQLAGFNISEDWWIIAVSGGGLLLIIIIVVTISSIKKKKKPKKRKKKSSKKKK
ncbi:MAG: choice-of-anchor S family protein [Candidatus Heimdallarchaeota archaeon]